MIKPSLVIGDPQRPYMLRWHILKSRHFPRVYLHKFLRSDDDRAPHDHPWWFISILLKGEYVEHRWYGTQDEPDESLLRSAPSIAFRPLSTKHRVELLGGADCGVQTCWTLIITGSPVRKWGFWCRDRFIPSRQFDGCGE